MFEFWEGYRGAEKLVETIRRLDKYEGRDKIKLNFEDAMNTGTHMAMVGINPWYRRGHELYFNVYSWDRDVFDKMDKRIIIRKDRRAKT